jgi:hypothetical protein
MLHNPFGIQKSLKNYMDKALLLALFKKLQAANRKIEELLRDQHSSLATITVDTFTGMPVVS